MEAGPGFSLPASRSYSDGHSIACLVLFLVAAFVTVRPIIIPVTLPNSLGFILYKLRLRNDQLLKRRTYHLPIDLNVGPLAAVLILLASKSIGIVEFRAGIKGRGDLHPYDILLLFLSLAYIAISLDSTGALRFLAFWVAKKGGTSGWKLHFYLFVFFLVLGGIVGNDPVILSGTAFLAYFTQACGIKPPTAWIFSQFIAANLTSMVLVSSNPTNLVISSASGINFIYFSGWTILPALFASIVLYPLLMFRYFRTTSPALVPRVLDTPEVYPRGELKDVRGAIFKAILLAVTLITLIVSSVLVPGIKVYWVTLPAAVLCFVRDMGHDIKHGSAPEEFENEFQADGLQTSADGVEMKVVSPRNDDISPASSEDKDNHEFNAQRWTLPGLWKKFAKRLPTVYSVVTRLPWPLLPFAFSFFILVESLSSSGWISVWAGWMSDVVRNNDVTAVFFVGFICILLCNISTNIGATLILVDIIYDERFTASNPSKRVQYGALFAIAVGSNVGAYSFVFPASLAGLLWRGILRQKGVELGSVQFLKQNILPLILTATVALAVVVGEVRIIFPDG